jgi:peptide/nickel transport system substrate-binding protein
VTRRAKSEVPSAGGWSAFITSWSSVDILDPVEAEFLNASRDKATFGWPCDAELEKLREAFARETNPAKQRVLAEPVQLRATEALAYIHLGQCVQPVATRNSVKGRVIAGNIALWNLGKQ